MKGLGGFVALCLATLHVESAIASPPHHSGRAGDHVTPTINLGYEIHLGTVNTTGNYYVFKNIPYAQQPVGELRFQMPVPPLSFPRLETNAGTQDVICLQAVPSWVLRLSATQAAKMQRRSVDAPEAVTTESCLVLDVYVPAGIFNKGAAAKAPVMIWIHGGGFVLGSKTSDGNPAGLIARSRAAGDKGMIVVSINYRLGMFGWLAGGDVTANLGLHDQRLAFEWVRQYIRRFGGDPKRVTIAGESAGGSSIVHHITAYGGAKGVNPFQAAIPMSPAWEFNIQAAKGYQTTLAAASQIAGKPVTSVAELRALSSEQLIQVNQAAVYVADTGTFTFGPTTDGSLVPAYPQILLHEKKFDKGVKIMTSHVLNESATFTSPNIHTPDDVRAVVRARFPEASNMTLDTLLTDIYPDAPNNGSKSQPWQTEFARTVQIGSEAFFSCITRYLALAKRNTTHNYLFAVPPGFHADDVEYVFFNGDTSVRDDGLRVQADLAGAIQDYIVSFVKTGDPNTRGLPRFPMYGERGTVVKFSDKGISTQVDDLKNGRCEWLQQAIVDRLL
ncbi:carboxylesterase [Xylariaceae sp. FL0594]|nr:carboxylesterase [Xylariaceae sp. FL0594]